MSDAEHKKVRASEASPAHKEMLDAVMRLRPQVLSKARELGLTSSTRNGYMCYRTNYPKHHFAIASYDMLVNDEDTPSHIELTVMHGKDSSSPGAARMGTNVNWIQPCGCGQWEMPTAEQIAAMKLKVARFQH